ncbi:hypothetical protein [Actinacidiphila sp. ITFR-21]|uniref:hypothetical protein n=1 Tax=Actinacidiphila sp. ITFR-21 TaxID=3075199 RepID=UPI00288B5437|nr:hypothetical protein [Streptomyces sp. ITFR-21]WNI16828.1 hypothetical protein RLT57_15755 [Streptomyces sp. ITFR-21]
MNEPLVEQLTTPPLLGLLAMHRRRTAGTGRALVLLRPDGADRVAYPDGLAPRNHPRPTLLHAWRTATADARWVSLAERRCHVEAPRHGRGGDGRAAEVPLSPQSVAWWVVDPVVVAREAPTEDEVAWRIVADAGVRGVWPHRPEPVAAAFAAGPPDPYRAAWAMERLGIAYRFLPRPPGPTGPPQGPALPAVWGAEHHEAYRFYRDVVAGGPHGLAALWLLYHPEQAKDVLEWTVAHRSVLEAPESWERSLASVLRDLNGDHRSFIGVKLAEVLSDAGVPYGEETLNRVREARANRTPGEPR